MSLSRSVRCPSAIWAMSGLVQRVAARPQVPDASVPSTPPSPDVLKRIVRRGQEAGQCSGALSADWLSLGIVQLAHGAAGETEAGPHGRGPGPQRASRELLRILGCAAPGGGKDAGRGADKDPGGGSVGGPSVGSGGGA
ncbi:hypothetical protein [Streptomyces iconiensis]|uniref:Uncharacterized protein n=1 Tax=Streptomyces iconiensis TaxID=1384038 RepID=A0ABT7A758_9ACTN|nr:hypothetical protein [Streptomyces iconiensis]MDJ1137175.1 hypothetical protein [Streptomyces iconiensis]